MPSMPLRRTVLTRVRNTLAVNTLQNGPFRSAKWAVLEGEMGLFATRNGPNRKSTRYGMDYNRYCISLSFLIVLSLTLRLELK